MKLIRILLALFICQVAFAQADLKKLDAYYEKAVKDWNIPGMSVAIVKDGKIIFEKGYGVKEVGKQEKTDEHTLYAIASNSKAFTSAVFGQLVDEGKVKWNDKVRKYLPYFELYDPWVSSEVNIRDILSHRVGLGTFSGDIIWFRSNLNGEQIVRRAKYLPKAYDFRSGYGYSNVMYITAGEVIRQVTGKSWSDNVKERFFQPLQMTRSITSIHDLDKKGNYAMPHSYFNKEHKPIPWESWDHVAATGGIISSVHDMAQWMIFNLNHGMLLNDTLLSKESRNMVWTPHASFNVDHTTKEKNTHLRAYGLGWVLSDYRGKLRVGHTGGYTGMLSGVTLIPDENLGIVVLTNGMRGIYGAVISYTIDRFLKAPEKDYSAELLANANKNEDKRIEERKKARVTGTKPSLSLDKYEGEYFTDTYGKITVKREGEKLRITFEHTPDLNATLEHWHFDTFEIKWENAAPLAWFSFGTVKFDLDNNNAVKRIEFDVPNDDFWFEELNAKKVK
ncbi:serine hydrolase [Chryseosolibacter indicus]|uniref:Beta-lactamase family protein n=1 Tax=Chryseosolibacter indicus TaxID=2782351 RepID=A0ABS5VQ06_9BACT|nr:serine hydrolase [Chryseosolibacter indicus]MBT1703431.1 beta-lactamase family protein [Chryseosolibacter indicus]